MSEAKHTPGPWWIDGEGIKALVRGDSGVIVAVRHRLPGQEHEANARLIAAAPDMAKALDHIASRLQMDMDDGGRPDYWSMEDLVRLARAALKKAETASQPSAGRE